MTDPIVVIGAGNAALSAAITAKEAGADVVVIEAAPVGRRGGNTYYSGAALRLPHEGIRDLATVVRDIRPDELESIDAAPYSKSQFLEHWLEVTAGRANPELAEAIIDRARPTVAWLAGLGTLELELPRNYLAAAPDGRQTLTGDVHSGWRGGGRGLSEGLFAAAEQRDIDIRYGTRAVGLTQDPSGRVDGVVVLRGARRERIAARAVVMACGGFEANPAMRAAYLGKGWDLARIRGTEFNMGDGHRMALDIGARPTGNWSSCHAVSWEISAPLLRDRSFAHGYERHCYFFGIVVNIRGRRFLDEGANFQPYTYAKYGGEVLAQPEARAFQIFDQQVEELLWPMYRFPQATRITGSTYEELARNAGIDVAGLTETIERYNDHVADKPLDRARLDGKGTPGLEPPKSNWAMRIEQPPFVAFPVTCAITFTYGGFAVDTSARLLAVDGQAIPGVFAAGELVGGLFYGNYPAGAGLLSGAVMGRTAALQATGQA